MNIELVVGRKPSGEFLLVSYSVQIEYDPEPFEFDIRQKREGHNIAEILRQYVAIDEIKMVKLIAQTPVVINGVNVYLDACMLCYDHNEVISWTARTNAPTDVETLLTEIQPSLRAANIVVCGTVRAVIPQVKEQHRQQIRDRAERAALRMISHGNSILAYLVGTSCVE